MLEETTECARTRLGGLPVAAEDTECISDCHTVGILEQKSEKSYAVTPHFGRACGIFAGLAKHLTIIQI